MGISLPKPSNINWPKQWPLFLSELIGTACLVFVGLSVVIAMSGAGSPLAGVAPRGAWGRLITGFLFGTTGAIIAISPVGKISGAHINPIVSLGFWLMGKLDLGIALGYSCAQLVGGILGSLPLIAWGAVGRSVAFGATAPGANYSVLTALLGEAITTFAMVALLCLFLGFRGSRRFTPVLFPFLYAVMVCIEAPISGTSTNPARSIGPAIVSGVWHGWWIYWLGPLIGMLLAILACSSLANRIEVAKLYYFDSNRGGLLRIHGRSLKRV